MAKKREQLTDTWIIDKSDGTIIEFDDFVFSYPDEKSDVLMACYRKGETVYFGKATSFSRRDAWELHQARKDEND